MLLAIHCEMSTSQMNNACSRVDLSELKILICRKLMLKFLEKFEASCSEYAEVLMCLLTINANLEI